MGVHGPHNWWYGCLERAGVVAKGQTSGERMHKARHAGQRVLDATQGNLKAVQKLLGQSSISTTGDVYTDWDIEQLAETLRDAPGRNRTCDLALRRRALYPLSYRRSAAKSSGGASGVWGTGSGFGVRRTRAGRWRSSARQAPAEKTQTAAATGHTASGCQPSSAPPAAGPRIEPALHDIELSAK